VKLLAISVLSSALETVLAPVAVDAGLMVVMLSSDANIKAAARTGRTTIVLRDHVDRLRFVLHHKLSGVGIPVRRLLVERLIAQGELQSIFGGLEPRILQGALKTGGVPPQQVVRLGALDGQTRCHVAVAIDIQPDLYAPEFRRIEADFKPVLAGESLARDFDRKSGDRNCRRLRIGL
jgi:hypothetical protein